MALFANLFDKAVVVSGSNSGNGCLKRGRCEDKNCENEESSDSEVSQDDIPVPTAKIDAFVKTLNESIFKDHNFSAKYEGNVTCESRSDKPIYAITVTSKSSLTGSGNGEEVDCTQATLGLRFFHPYEDSDTAEVVIDQIYGKDSPSFPRGCILQVSGGDLMKALVKIINIENVQWIRLADYAIRQVEGIDVSEEALLSPLLKIATGKGYYEKFGFVIFDEKVRRQYNESYDVFSKLTMSDFVDRLDNPEFIKEQLEERGAFWRPEEVVGLRNIVAQKEEDDTTLKDFVIKYTRTDPYKYLLTSGIVYSPTVEGEKEVLESIIFIARFLPFVYDELYLFKTDDNPSSAGSS